MDQLERTTINVLKKVCFNTGISPVGTKPLLIKTIQDEFKSRSIFDRKPNNGRSFNLLSIDMGIRNFAYTRLELDKQLPFNRPPLVKEWTKFDVNDWADVSHDQSFQPSKYAEICYQLVETVLFNPNEQPPDLIMIERQRARTLGSNSILEWVFRVNMFESMLHALIYSKAKQNLTTDLHTDIVSTIPLKMGNYWKPDSEIKPKDSKNYRIALVEQWLNDIITRTSKIQPFVLDPSKFKVKETSLDGTKSSRSKTKWINQVLLSDSDFIKQIYQNRDKSNVIEKGDDLVDSILHALSWIDWERNKMILKLEFSSSLEDGLKLNDQLYESHFRKLAFLKEGKRLRDKENTPTPKKTRSKRKTTKIQENV